MAEPPTPPLRRNGDLTPVPDPTVQTTLVLEREIAALRELMFTRIDGDRAVVETRLTAMDQAIRLVREIAAELPARVDEKIAHQREVRDKQFLTVDERFHGIEVQFAERDQRIRDSRASDSLALAAALQSAKEAVGEANKAGTLSIDKLALSTSEQIKQGVLVADTNFRAINDKIEAIDKRVTRSEGQGQGQGQLWGYIVGGVGLVGSVIAIFLVFATRVP